MKRVAIALVGLAALALAWLMAGFLPRELGRAPAVAPAGPPVPAVALRLAVLHTGQMHTRAALAFRGGSWSDRRRFVMPVLLVEHPRGRLLIDAGFGRHVGAHFRATPRLLQWTTRYEHGVPAVRQLAAMGLPAAGLDGVIVTHSHWDHVSGLADLPEVPVYLSHAEREFIDSGHEMAALMRTMRTGPWRRYDFPDGPYLGFEASRDWFGDGSLVVVPAPGHTPGSVIVFVHRSDGLHLALIGDAAWQSEGVTWPAEKPWIASRAADHDPAALRRLLLRLHALQQAVPGLMILPAHDARAWERLAGQLQDPSA